MLNLHEYLISVNIYLLIDISCPHLVTLSFTSTLDCMWYNVVIVLTRACIIENQQCHHTTHSFVISACVQQSLSPQHISGWAQVLFNLSLACHCLLHSTIRLSLNVYYQAQIAQVSEDEHVTPQSFASENWCSLTLDNQTIFFVLAHPQISDVSVWFLWFLWDTCIELELGLFTTFTVNYEYLVWMFNNIM